MSFHRVAVLGLGKVGLLAARLLHEAGFDVTGFDRVLPRSATPFPVRIIDVASRETVATELAATEAVLSCLPYHLNRGLAGTAHGLAQERK